LSDRQNQKAKGEIMKMKIPYIPSLLLAVVMARADVPQSALTVAVYDFTATSEMDLGQKVTNWNASLWNARRETARDVGPNVTALVTANLAMETNLVLVERAELNKALSEQAFGVSGLVSADAAAKIGAITGAKILVTGQVINTGNNLIIVADIIGTETGRLFADKVQGASDNLGDLTTDLSGKIARTISMQATNLIAPPVISLSDSLDRAVNNLTGTNRPSVSIKIFYSTTGSRGHSAPTETELGMDLLKAGFPVVDDESDRKPDIEITGIEDMRAGGRTGALYSFRCNVELKVQDRRTGNIITLEHQESSASDSNRSSADHGAQVQAAEQLAEKIMPLLSK
jgi:TolB-like protein